MAPFYGCGSAASRLVPLRGGSLLFTTKFPEIPGTHFIDLGRMNGWVDLGATQWFWTRDRWIGNWAPQPLRTMSLMLFWCLYYWLWQDFILCFDVSIVDFEQSQCRLEKYQYYELEGIMLLCFCQFSAEVDILGLITDFFSSIQSISE